VLTRIMMWVFIPVLLLTLLWPALAGHYVGLGLAVGAAAMGALEASRTGKYHRQAAYGTASPKVKYDN